MRHTLSLLQLPLIYSLRELRGGIKQFIIFIISLILGVGTIAAVNTLSQMTREGIASSAKELLGGDLSVTISNRPTNIDELTFLQKSGTLSTVTEMRSMVSAGEKLVLVELKAVDESWPLIGTALFQSGKTISSVLTPETVSVEKTLLQQLNIDVGDTIQLGYANYIVADITTKEPDRIVSTFSFGPRILMSKAGLERTGLTGPLTLQRTHHRLLLPKNITSEQFRTNAETLFSTNADWKITDYRQENPSIERNLERLNLFLTLAGLSSLLIGGIGIAISTRAYLSRRVTAIATLRSLGTTSGQVFCIYLYTLLLVTFIALALALAAGLGATAIAAPFLREMIPVTGSALIYGKALALSAWFGLLTMLTFSLLPLAHGVAVPPALLLRGGKDNLSKNILPYRYYALFIICATALVSSMLFLTSSDQTITRGFIAVTIASFLLLASISLLLQTITRRLYSHSKRPWLRLAISNLHRPGNVTTSIMVALGSGLTVLVALSLIEINLRYRIENTIPKQAPSLFILDIQPNQLQDFTTLLESHKTIENFQTALMTRGRITHLNNIPVASAEVHPKARWAVSRERGFSESAIPPANMTLVRGKWWPENYEGPPLVSLDDRVMRGTGLKPGDSISFTIAGKAITATIASSRKMNYSSMQINFATVFSPGSISQLAHTHIATTRIINPDDEIAIIRDINNTFPNISVIRVRDSIALVQTVIDQISLALRWIIGLVLITGVVVLSAALIAVQEKRLYDTVILKVLGAGRAVIIRSLLAEWSAIALFASSFSAVMGSLAAWLVLRYFGSETFHIPFSFIAILLLSSLIVIQLAGTLLNWRVLQAKAAAHLRND